MKFLSKLFVPIAALSLLWACQPEDEIPAQNADEQCKSFTELLAAYDAGKLFDSAVHNGSVCEVSFSDGSKVIVPESDFEIDDCTASIPKEVTVSGAYWSVGGTIKPIKVEGALPNHKAQVVYACFDSVTLYLWLSNREQLTFQGVMNEIERQQNLPVVKIVTEGGAAIVDKKNYVKGTIEISDPEHLYSDEEVFEASMGIRGRGNSTWGWPKKPWKVKLDSKASVLGMPADKEWCLLANYSDRTLMRNMVAMRLSEICGFSWTPRMRSVEVYLNGSYQGVYTFCEHKKVSSSRVNIDVVGENVTSGDALTGDYYFEMEENQDETACWWTDMGVPMMFSEPEEPNSAQFDYAKKYFSDFENALKGSSFADPQKGYAAYIDVDSFINYYIVQELTKNVDGNLRKSSFLTKTRGGKLEMYHLWDFDLTLGNCGYLPVGNGPDGFWIKDYDSNATKGRGWYHRLFQDPAFVDKVQARWDELYPQLESVVQWIKTQALILGPAQKHNFSKWSIWESVDWVKFPSLGSYEAEVDYLVDFYTKRLKWLDTELHKL